MSIYIINLHLPGEMQPRHHRNYFTSLDAANAECVRTLTDLINTNNEELGTMVHSYRWTDPKPEMFEGDLGTHSVVDENGDVVLYADVTEFSEFVGTVH